MIFYHFAKTLIIPNWAGVTSLQGIIPFEKGIILFVKKNHSFFAQESFLFVTFVIPFGQIVIPFSH